MKLDLAAWPDGTTAKEFEETGETLDLASDMSRFPSAAHVQMLVHKSSTEVIIEGRLSIDARSTCVRCLEEFDFPVAEDFRRVATLVPDEKANEDTGDPDYVFLPQSVGEWDLNDSFREMILLAIPDNPLCREDCLGLCPHCGANRNLTKCQCPADHSGSQFKNLAEILAAGSGRARRRGHSG